MRFVRGFVISSAVLLILYSLTGFVGAPYLMRDLAQDLAFEATGQTLEIGTIDVNPFTFDVSIEGIALKDASGRPHLTVKSVAVEADLSGLVGDDKTVKSLVVNDTHFYSDVKEEDGSLGLLDILNAPNATDGDAQESQTSILVNQFRVSDVRLTLRPVDGLPELEDTTLGPLSLVIDDFVTKPDMASNLSDLSVELGGGKAMLSGGLTVSPFALDVGFDMVDIDLQHLHQLAALVKQKLPGIEDIRGVANTKGRVQITDMINLTLDASLSGVEIEESIENSRIFAMEELNIAGVSAQYAPDADAGNRVAVEKMTLTKPKLGLVRLDDGSLLLPGLSDDTDNEPPTDAASAVQFDLKALSIKDGSVTFEDRGLKTATDAQITNIDVINIETGPVGFPVSDTDNPTEFEFDGLFAGESTIRAKGRSRLAAPYQTDAELVIDRLPYKAIASYSGEHLGRNIDAGELFLDLKYKIPTTVIDGHNIILFNGWQWGDAVESEDAADVPLDLAFSLLEDKDGRVKLDIPVNGDLSDPEFEIGPLIQKATGNLITGIVSSPFKLLGSLIPGGKDDLDLSAVSFPAGEADIPTLEKAKLSALAVSLNERPKLRLTIEGAAYKELWPGNDETAEGEVEKIVMPPPELASLRAEAIKQFLIEAGVGESRLILLPISIDEGKAKSQIKNKLGVVSN